MKKALFRGWLFCSQPSNRGSIPRSATTVKPLKNRLKSVKKGSFEGFFLLIPYYSFYRLNTTKYHTILRKREGIVKTLHINKQEFSTFFRNHSTQGRIRGTPPGAALFIHLIPLITLTSGCMTNTFTVRF